MKPAWLRSRFMVTSWLWYWPWLRRQMLEAMLEVTPPSVTEAEFERIRCPYCRARIGFENTAIGDEVSSFFCESKPSHYFIPPPENPL